MKQAQVSEKVENTSKAYHFTNIQELITITNGELEDILYIGEKTSGRNYRSDFTFKTKAEVAALHKKNTTKISTKDTTGDFFVYNERTGEIVPFKKNDYLMYDRGYATFDGKKYLSYDDNGNELGNFGFSKN